eukprot:jgi/Undpi1/13709/HiC_scaffold_9.g03362.m1
MRLSAVKAAFCCCWPFYNFSEAAARAAHPSRSSESGDRPLTASVGPESQETEGHENVDVRHGVLFQTNGCPQAITPAQANDSVANSTFTGNTIHLQSQTPGRTGNHFEDVSQFFSMAYRCRSSLFVLSGKDDRMPSEDGGIWKSTRRWYDFSGAKMDLRPEFADLYGRPDVCPPNQIESGLNAYRLIGVYPDLLDCLNHVFVGGCEAQYLGSVVKTTEFCRPTTEQKVSLGIEGINTEELCNQDSHQRRLRKSRPSIHGFLPPTTAVDNTLGDTSTGSSQSAGSLVIHIRLGDIFNPKGEGGKRQTFGQPPLQFYLDAIGSKAWSDVFIFSSWTDSEEMNPTYEALQLLNDAGTLGSNVVLLHDRPLLDDLRAMLCADGLAAARSSLHFLTFAHTTASTLYLPDSCGPGTYTRQTRPQNAGLQKRSPDNATLLVLEKPGVEVYGIEWGEQPQRSYTPYEKWSDSDKQLLEMVTFDGVKGLKRCTIDD